jgi:hypothetical protein
MSQEHDAKRDHVAWLKDCGRWRSQHRQTLAMLAKVQAAILQHEAALESHVAEIHSHELHLQDYVAFEEGIEYGPGSPDFAQLETAHDEFARRHEQAREMHTRIEACQVNVLAEVEKLLKACEGGMESGNV